MTTVYTVAFSDGKFLMVFNKKRGGWEMPGGKVEAGEDIAEAAEREFAEEAGYSVDIVKVRDLGNCHVCAAFLGGNICSPEMEGRLFDSLPEELSFDRQEYEDVVPWAMRVLGKDGSVSSGSTRI
ncbi:MAG: NUDIX domain-containing protein [Candidatus Methanomethylophilaceae archaeon]|nr:NUDIX domain-containing protein [Candidatus Methanomethylophilaceae archaeon]